MKNLDKVIRILIVAQIVTFGCTVNSKKDDQQTSADTVMRQMKLENKNIVSQSSIDPYRQLDSILRLTKSNFSSISKLDSLCLSSDGDLSESLNAVVINIFNSDLKHFSTYLIENPNSCLKYRLIEGLGNNYSVYKKEDRNEKIIEEKNRLIISANKMKLKRENIDVIKNVFNEINPNLLD